MISIPTNECSCSCCIGLTCNPIQLPNLYIPWCIDDDAACVSLCRMIYPINCNDIDSQTFGVCVSDDAPTIFDQYISLNLFGLICIIIIQMF
jgi:hypothetical protein